jgi:hypothetical protein
MSRNVWLSFSEWELICQELVQKTWNPFQMSKRDLMEWKEDIQNYHSKGYSHGEPQYCFKRVGIYSIVEKLQSSLAINALCREYWRRQDMQETLTCPYTFIGFILTHVENVNMETTLTEWTEIQNQMRVLMRQSDKRCWFADDLVDLYKEVIS